MDSVPRQPRDLSSAVPVMQFGKGPQGGRSMSHTVTIIDSIKPAVVRKKYTMTDDVMKKTVIASITEGVGVSREITTAREFADLLAEVTESDSLVICAGQWMGANDKPFRIIPEEELARIGTCQ